VSLRSFPWKGSEPVSISNWGGREEGEVTSEQVRGLQSSPDPRRRQRKACKGSEAQLQKRSQTSCFPRRRSARPLCGGNTLGLVPAPAGALGLSDHQMVAPDLQSPRSQRWGGHGDPHAPHAACPMPRAPAHPATTASGALPPPRNSPFWHGALSGGSENTPGSARLPDAQDGARVFPSRCGAAAEAGPQPRSPGTHH